MDCPQCRAPMVEETLQGKLGRPIGVDLCFACQAFWFDSHESLRIAPAATLKLFRIIGEHAAREPAAPPTAGSCPRCGRPLRPTSDMQRNTRFEYLRCPDGHGRWMTFYSFLRAKDFIKPLSPAQIDELRQNVQMLNCSNCGAAIDLSTATGCGHCGSPVSMLDMSRARQLVETLQRADRTGTPVDPALALRLEQARRSVHSAFDAFEGDEGWPRNAGSTGLVGAGLTSIARWLSRSRR
jgi:hypothetical protein